MIRKKHPFTGYPAVKHPKHNKFAITNIREKPSYFFIVQHGRRLKSAIIFQTQVPLQKFPFLFIIIIPCLYVTYTTVINSDLI